MSRQYRYEMKFVVNEIKLTEFSRWLWSRTTMREAFPERIINSLYFDDLKLNAVKDNLIGIANREKFRLRWYSDVDKQTVNGLCLEKKVREGRLGYKESAQLLRLQDVLLDTDIGEIKHAIMDEFAALGLFRHNRDVFPSLHVSYRRQYLQDNEDIRITVDNDINFHYVNGVDKLFALPPTPFGKKIIEIKFAPELKNRAAALIRPLHLVPQRCSKYLQGMAMHGMAVYL